MVLARFSGLFSWHTTVNCLSMVLKAMKFTFCINIVEMGIPEYDVLGGYDAMMIQRHILPILEQTVEEYSVTW